MKTSRLLPFGLCILTPFSLATVLDIGYDSKYITEGRNNLTAGGMFWFSGVQPIYENVAVTAAYGIATSSMVKYNELNIGVEYLKTMVNIEYFLAYSHLEFFDYSQNDDELSAGLTWLGFERARPSIYYLYSVEAAGSFIELKYEYELFVSPGLNVLPYAIAAWDLGYASSLYDGHNHTAIGIVSAFTVDDNMTVNVVGEHTLGGSDVKNEHANDDQTWFGIHFTFSW